MSSYLLIYLAVFAAGLMLTACFTPVCRVLAEKLDFMDRPADNHKGHGKATALLGGAAMFSAWIGCIAVGTIMVVCGIYPEFIRNTVNFYIPGLKSVASQIFFVILGALAAVALGLIDDKIALSAKSKFSGQFVIACIAVFGGGIRMNLSLDIPALSVAAALFWIMLMMNSINFFDNMDGLAVGTIAIAMLFFTFIAAMNGQYFMAIFSALNCGVCCGFWIYNSSPASIFMGDSGSHFLGYLAAVVAAEVTFFDKGYSLSRFPVLIPLLILAVPLFDTMMVVLIRSLNKKPFWIGDHNHISHRFVKMGFSRPKAVLLVHLSALAVAVGTLPIYWGDFRTAAILVFQAFLFLLIITVLQFNNAEK